MNKKIWLSPPNMGGSEMKYIKEAFDQNWVAPLGPNVDFFEKELAAYAKINNALALSSGTAAIHLALLALGVQPGDFVICSSLTFCGSANPIKYVGANPVFIDSDRESWGMSPILLEEAILKCIKERKKPSAIILVHLYGMPAKIHSIMDISRKYSIPVIEDAAEALGSEYYKVKLGTYGDIGVYSFNGNKIITTSGGGALISATSKYVKKAKFLSTQARENYLHYEHLEIGYNYRMSNILAGIGRGQLEVLDKYILRKREVNKIYRENLVDDRITFFKEWDEHCYSNYWLTCCLLNDRNLRDRIMHSLNAENIDCRPLWKPMHLQPVFKNELFQVDGTSEDLFNRGLCLPSGSNLEANELEIIIENIQRNL